MEAKALVAAIVAGALALGVASALAAAPFDHANPGPGDVLATPPARVDLYTKGPTSPALQDTQLIVTGPDGRQADGNDSAVDPADHHHVEVSLKAGLPAGRYVVGFKTRGEKDLEQDGGVYAFYVGAGPTAADRAADKKLQVSNLDEGLSLRGYRRGIVEGGLGLVFAVPATVYLLYRRGRRRAQEQEAAHQR